MSFQSWQELLFSSVSDATAVTGTAESLMVPNITLAAGYMTPGRTLRATLKGVISNIATTPGTMLVRARWGGLTGTTLVASAALAQITTVQTNDQFELEFTISCRTNGTAGTMFTSGKIFQGNAPTAPAMLLIPTSANAVVASLDTTVAQALSFTNTFSLTGNSMTINQYLLEALN